MENTVEELAPEVQRLVKQISTYNETISKQQMNIKELIEKKLKYENEAKGYDKKIKSLETKLADVTPLIDKKLVSSVSDLEARHEELKQGLTTIENDREKLQDEINKTLNEEIEPKRVYAVNLKKEAENLMEKAKNANILADKKLAMNGEVIKENIEMKKRLAEKTNIRSKEEAQFIEDKKQFDLMKADYDNKAKNLVSLEAQNKVELASNIQRGKDIGKREVIAKELEERLAKDKALIEAKLKTIDQDLLESKKLRSECDRAMASINKTKEEQARTAKELEYKEIRLAKVLKEKDIDEALVNG
jgi:hypothetical protein